MTSSGKGKKNEYRRAGAFRVIARALNFRLRRKDSSRLAVSLFHMGNVQGRSFNLSQINDSNV